MVRRKGEPAKRVSKRVDVAKLEAEYTREAPVARRLISCLDDQMSTLLKRHNIALGVPIEARVKDWSSIEEKIGRKTLRLDKVADLDDLVGMRFILLFRTDLNKLDNLIRSNLEVLSVEDTAERLGEAQFGYQSQHYIIKVHPSWLQIPSYSDLGGLKAEVQVRTLAQHIWAAASHKLQYKREESVPPPLRRAIYRVSALLETVDLEFERVLFERTEYVANNLNVAEETALNVDLISAIVKEILPAENGDDDEEEQFDDLLENLQALGINTAGELRRLLTKNLEKILAADKEAVKEFGQEDWVDAERTSRGVYFNYTGLVRQALSVAFTRGKLRSLPGIVLDD